MVHLCAIFVLIKRGIAALQDSKQSLDRLFIFPVAMTVWALVDISHSFDISNYIVISKILLGLIIGIPSGYLLTMDTASFASDREINW